MKFEVNIGGIKCDNPECDYVDQEVKVEEYDKYLNAPCPKCGANLLTEADYNIVKMALKMQKLFSKIPFGNKGPVSRYKVDMDGTGLAGMQITELDSKEKGNSR